MAARSQAARRNCGRYSGEIVDEEAGEARRLRPLAHAARNTPITAPVPVKRVGQPMTHPPMLRDDRLELVRER